MKKSTKAEIQKFVNNVTVVLIQYNPVLIEDSSYTLFIETPIGKVYVYIDDEPSEVYAIDLRFENANEARKHYDCNPYNGKLNILEEDADDAVNIFANMLKYMMNINQ